MPVPRQAGSDHLPGQHVQRGEQRGRAVPLVVMGHRLRPTGHHRQRRLGAVQRLHGGLLVHTQHDRVVRRVQIQPDDIDQLLLEPRIVRQLERLHQMRLQSPRRPDPLHRILRHPDPLRHRPARPMRLTRPVWNAVSAQRSRRSSPSGSSASDHDPSVPDRTWPSPPTANRDRQAATVAGLTPTSAAIRFRPSVGRHQQCLRPRGGFVGWPGTATGNRRLRNYTPDK